MNLGMRFAVVSFLLLGQPCLGQTLAPAPADLDGLRRFYLADIHELHDYRPGKNSFVEGPDRRWGSYQAPGQRLTLLDLQGRGRLCHIWSTWREGQGNHRLEFFLDGAARPQFSGTLDELIAAAQAMPHPPAPVVGFVGNRHARNLFLPIPFERGLRIEMETLEPTWLIFWQIDYRLDQRPTSDRLIAAMADGKPVFRWEGTAKPASETPAGGVKRNAAVIPAGATAPVIELAGPAIVRRFTLHTDLPKQEHEQLDLEIRYDGAASAAVRASVADFFGPFAGVALHSDASGANRSCYFPLPFRKSATIAVRNRSQRPVRAEIAADVENVPAWNDRWGYFHAVGQQTPKTTGYRQHEVLYLHGRGHWLGMALYNTGHDHGGGDFAVIDAAGSQPAFLHGVNGEDYFTFAWFGRGQHHPFAIAKTNEEGRYRHHFENPYPFQKSLSVYWGTYPDLATRSVAYWYQDAPGDTTVKDSDNPLSVEWDCFGPVPLTLDKSYRPSADWPAALPSVADLDAGKQFECRAVSERFTSGWMRQRSIGPVLDLTYLSRHGTRIKGEVELGGMGHAWLARRRITSATPRRAVFQLSHDDPLRVLVNGREVRACESHNGFATEHFTADLRAGENEIVVQLTSFFNVNFNWAAFALREAALAAGAPPSASPPAPASAKPR